VRCQDGATRISGDGLAEPRVNEEADHRMERSSINQSVVQDQERQPQLGLTGMRERSTRIGALLSGWTDSEQARKES
jgi:hypothetical protein